MKQAVIEVRVNSAKKAKAQARAREQGVTLSEGVRRLLHLWIEGEIDVTAVNVEPGPGMKIWVAGAERKTLTDAEFEALDPSIRVALADESLAAMLAEM